MMNAVFQTRVCTCEPYTSPLKKGDLWGTVHVNSGHFTHFPDELQAESCISYFIVVVFSELLFHFLVSNNSVTSVLPEASLCNCAASIPPRGSRRGGPRMGLPMISTHRCGDWRRTAGSESGGDRFARRKCSLSLLVCGSACSSAG